MNVFAVSVRLLQIHFCFILRTALDVFVIVDVFNVDQSEMFEIQHFYISDLFIHIICLSFVPRACLKKIGKF